MRIMRPTQNHNRFIRINFFLDRLLGCRLILSTTDLAGQDYGNEFIQAYKLRLRVGDSPGDTVTGVASDLKAVKSALVHPFRPFQPVSTKHP